MQATCAAVGLLSSIAAWLAGATLCWLIAGVLLGSVIPFTLIIILPTNKRLLSPTLDRRSAEAERLLARWGRLHAVRSVLSGLALLLFLYLAIFRKAILEPSLHLSVHDHGLICNGCGFLSRPAQPLLQNSHSANSVEFLTKQLYSFGATVTIFQF